MVAHNGEINTLRGNLNWMAARQASVSSPLFGKDIEKLWPISYEGQSDTACFDNALEFLVQGGYSLAHAAMMLIPEAWAGNPLMDAKRRAFYEYHACLMEPWDGPAAMAFTDGRQIGATLDRNGLAPCALFRHRRRPRRHGVGDRRAARSRRRPSCEKWRLQPGKMLLIDLEKGRIISDEEIKAELAGAHPYQQWLDRTQIRVHELPGAPPPPPRTNVSLLDRQQAFGYTQESLKFLMMPMAESGQEAVGSMGTDTPLSALSDTAEAAAHLFQAELRPSDQPADRPDPRGAGHVARHLYRAAAEPARPRRHLQAEAARGGASDPHQREPGAHSRHRRGRRQPVPHRHPRHHLWRRSWRCRHGRGARPALPPRRRSRSRRREHHHPVRPRHRSRPRADPVAARDQRRASSSDPLRAQDLGRPRGRDRRGARGASILRRLPATAPRRSIPISPSRPSRPCCPSSTRRSPRKRRSSATSRRSTRASSR